MFSYLTSHNSLTVCDVVVRLSVWVNLNQGFILEKAKFADPSVGLLHRSDGVKINLRARVV